MRSLLQVTKFHRSCGSGTQPQKLTHTLTSTANVKQDYDADGYFVFSYAGRYVRCYECKPKIQLTPPVNEPCSEANAVLRLPCTINHEGVVFHTQTISVRRGKNAPAFGECYTKSGASFFHFGAWTYGFLPVGQLKLMKPLLVLNCPLKETWLTMQVRVAGCPILSLCQATAMAPIPLTLHRCRRTSSHCLLARAPLLKLLSRQGATIMRRVSCCTRQSTAQLEIR